MQVVGFATVLVHQGDNKAPLRILFPYTKTQIEAWQVAKFVNNLQDMIPVTVDTLDRDTLRFHMTSRQADPGFDIQTKEAMDGAVKILPINKHMWSIRTKEASQEAAVEFEIKVRMQAEKEKDKAKKSEKLAPGPAKIVTAAPPSAVSAHMVCPRPRGGDSLRLM